MNQHNEEWLNRAAGEKVMGWTMEPETQSGYRPLYFDAMGEPGQDVFDWQPTLDIAQAFMLVEKLRTTGLVFSLHSPDSWYDDGEYRITREWIADFGDNKDLMFATVADTAPRAIVLAALAAVGVAVSAEGE